MDHPAETHLQHAIGENKRLESVIHADKRHAKYSANQAGEEEEG